MPLSRKYSPMAQPENGARNCIGAGSDGASALTGDVAEVLIYNAALTPANRRSVQDYLWAKYFASGPPRANDFPLANGLGLHATGDARAT